MTKKKGLIVGSSGLIGKELLHYLLESDEYESIYSLVRRKQNISHKKLTEVVINFDMLEDYKEYFEVDDVFSCLGTTIKKAKSKAIMEKVDVTYPLNVAKLAYENGAKQFLFVSSMNADEKSPFWYPRLKAKLEKEISKIPFHAILIFRPSLLLGERQEVRLGERFAAALFKRTKFIFKGRMKKYKAIKGKTVAFIMSMEAQNRSKGIRIYESEKIEEIANSLH